MADWEMLEGLMGGRNYILDGEGFAISYNPNPRTSLFDSDLFDSDDDGPETALVKKKDNSSHEYFILNGDFREAYENLFAQGFEACKRFFDQQSAHARSSWSS